MQRWKSQRGKYCTVHGWQANDKFTINGCRECFNLKRSKWRFKNRLEIYSHYSTEGKICCSICKEDEIKFLCLDHINGGGNKHRQKLGGVREAFADIKRAGFPDGYRILCHNCNIKHGCKDYYGTGCRGERLESEVLQTAKAIKSRIRLSNQECGNGIIKKTQRE